jgi:uncharacterized phage protein (TIGR01671 family)
MDKRFQFRAWDKVDSVMWPYADVRIGGYTFVSPDTSHDNTMFLRESEAIIMQCTGLTDKDGRDIYEGDIVEFGGDYYKIVFEDACFWITQENYAMELHTTIGMADIIVIGNCYENLDHLEDDND